jgi:predicted N-acetyltransferase YhbS
MPIRIEATPAKLPDREIIELWNASFGPEFPLTGPLWRQNTYNDPSFRPSDVILARDENGGLQGFALAKLLRDAVNHPGERLDKYAGHGYIAALAVRPESQRSGIGGALLAKAESYLAENGANHFYLGESFRHFLPGIPANYPPALSFFSQAGYTIGITEADLDGPLDPAAYEPAIAAARQVTFRQGQPGEEAALLGFLNRAFPGRWHYDTRLFLEQGGRIEDATLVLDLQDQIQGFLLSYKPGDKIIGPGRYWLTDRPDWGGIGPLGLSKELRGLGAGLGVVGAGMRHLHQNGLKFARIDWTTLLDFYGRLGFQPALTYRRSDKPFVVEAEAKG